jgi:hypothetical protein
MPPDCADRGSGSSAKSSATAARGATRLPLRKRQASFETSLKRTLPSIPAGTKACRRAKPFSSASCRYPSASRPETRPKPCSPAALTPDRTSAGSSSRWRISPGCDLNERALARSTKRGASIAIPSLLSARLSRDRTLGSIPSTSSDEASSSTAQAFEGAKRLPSSEPSLRLRSTAMRSTNQRSPSFAAESWPRAAMALTRAGLSPRIFAAAAIGSGSTIWRNYSVHMLIASSNMFKL